MIHSLRTPLVLATFAALFSACAQTDQGADDVAPSPATEVADAPAGAVSEAALAIEQAQRLLDRGGDAEEAIQHLERALAAPNLSDDERSDAVVALSRAQEAAGHGEKAIAVLEEELASKRVASPEALRRRLRKLLQTEELPTYLGEQRPTPNVARMLSRYFPIDDADKASIKIFLFGGDRTVSEDVGTFNLAAAMRADREQSCPLCSADLGISQGIHRGDWVSIPENRDDLQDALVVFYFDLEHNRIPARYESLLPMPVAEIEAELEAGRSFVVAEERAEAPPVLLLAAPRAALLADLEREMAKLEALPTERQTIDIATQIRATEIRSAVRGAWVPTIRTCYETLREQNPAAEGKLITAVDIGGDGAVVELTFEPTPALDDETFLDCVRSAGEGLRFPAIGKKTTFRYPFVLSN